MRLLDVLRGQLVSYYAHSSPNPSQPPPDGWQLLNEHLRAVANGARQLAQELHVQTAGFVETAHAAGLLHDLGKYRAEFQQMIRGLPVQKEKTYHKQAGAAKAALERNTLAAFAIAGHHGGMPDKAKLVGDVKGESGAAVVTQIWQTAVNDCPELSHIDFRPPAVKGALADLLTRLVFSCLVDADWSDTAEHERRVKGLEREAKAPVLEAATWLHRLLAFIERTAEKCQEKSPEIAVIRGQILQACLAAGEYIPGLFSLTVPTGGGKTLSGLAFALKHAAHHRDGQDRPRFRRIIYVAPYLTIIDQNARVIRQALGFGPEALEVFEHHSLAEPPGDEDENLLQREAAARRAENWDTPLIITTSVQFFESLFSNKPSRCRKLHNIARSVIILDECQTLPPDLVAPTCSMLGQLAAQLGCTIVLCTATQPAFDHIKIEDRLAGVREIIPPDLNLFERLTRVRISWPGQGQRLEWAAVAATMAQEPAALCIVNTRRAARELFVLLKEHVAESAFHLSTGMCPAHRLAVLDTVKVRLEKHERCYLVSTQLIEAGVDIDFPFVLREVGPLEAIIQSAGRCNREMRLRGPDGKPGGRVLVFRTVEGRLPSDAWYRAGRSVVEQNFLNHGREPRIDNSADIREYFERLYHTGELDRWKIQSLRNNGNMEQIPPAAPIRPRWACSARWSTWLRASRA
jgi:CRISPR-associated endonuclease/helicase Cas3